MAETGTGERQKPMSFRRTMVLWWLLFLTLQQAERLYLLPSAWAREEPSFSLLVQTLTVGFRADLIVATIALALALLGTVLGAALFQLFPRLSGGGVRFPKGYSRLLSGWCVLIALLLLVLLTVDMGYYSFNQHHLNFVFFEYVDDLFTQTQEVGLGHAQAAQQTHAELQRQQNWGPKVLGFFVLEGLALAGCWVLFRKVVTPLLDMWGTGAPISTNGILLAGLVAGGLGFHPQGPYAIRITDISSAEYYTLAQNPILFASEALRATVASRMKGEHLPLGDVMSYGEAVQGAQAFLGQGAEFPDPRYPFVHRYNSHTGVQFSRPANVVLILVEALDRRFLNRIVRGVHVTPFLDRLKLESLYFENFFTNGVQTARGIFSSLCSFYPRQGHAAMKTRYAHDYLCLPSVLRRAGYHTEMIISEHRDLNRLQLFVSNNGMQRLLDQSDFPVEVEHIGSGPSLGKSDGALLSLLRTRIETLQKDGNPFFLTTLTLGTHHPFVVPSDHPDIRVLRNEADGYVAALRYLDMELEKFFRDLLASKGLANTVVFILGDHGRHEVVGDTTIEKQAGHFLAPLFLWMDPALRSAGTYHPRTVSVVASQVDLAPTILGLNGLLPQVSPFLGRDLSCLLVADCQKDNVAFLSSVYDDMIGLVDAEGLLLYSLRSQAIGKASLTLERIPSPPLPVDQSMPPKLKALLSLYIAANGVLDRNAVWSWSQYDVHF